MKLWRKILLIIFALAFVVGCVWAIYIFRSYDIARETYEETIELYVTEAVSNNIETQEDATATSKDKVFESVAGISVDFEALQKENPDIIGWIYIPDTDISYPILFGEDNSQYLHTDYKGKSVYAGSIFTDFRNSSDFSDENTIVYGHNMRDGSMFGSLKEYQDELFLRLHPTFYIITPEAEMEYNVYSIFTTNKRSDNYEIDFSDDEDRQEYIDYVCDNTEIITGITPEIEDKTVMLSTCTTIVWNERFVVHGVLTNTNVFPTD